jgi:hypothetical protein
MFRASILAASLALGLASMPVGAVTLRPVPAASDVTLIAGGCGPGFHRGPAGGCRANVARVCVWRAGVRYCR